VVSDWDYGRCKSLLEEVGHGAHAAVDLLDRHPVGDFPVRSVLSDVDQLFNALRKVKALLVRERKSRA
jgi:hypothetical protein